jgi:hypothetical protein
MKYREGDETLITVQGNVEGLAKAWLDRESIAGIELEPEKTWSRNWIFADMTLGEHEFRATLMSLEGSILDEDVCYFTLLPACTDLEDTEADVEYIEGDDFASGSIDFFVRDGSTAIVDTEQAGGSGNEILILSGLLIFDFGTSPDGLTLRYGQGTFETPYATLEINGKSWNGGLLDSASGISLGGVKVTAGDGFLKLDGTINSFMIGGNDLAIDDICPE